MYKRLKERREDINDAAFSGRTSTSTTNESFEAVKEMILNNHRITIREIADDVQISFASCQAIFTDVLDMKRATAKIVPKLLNFELKQRCKDIALEMLTTFDDDPDLCKKVITGEESWAWGIEIKAQ